MIIDTQLLFSDAQAVTADANSTNVIDISAALRDLGRGGHFRVRVQVDTVMDSAGEGATLIVKLVESADAALGTPTTLYATAAIAEATLVAGYVIFDILLPKTSLQYLGIQYDRGVEDFTTGNISAFLLLDTPTTTTDRVLGNTGL